MNEQTGTNKYRYCLHCMTPVTQTSGACPHCGHDVNGGSQFGSIVPGTYLHSNQYLVGDVIGQGGFGITYIGKDVGLNITVAIKEYYPNGISARDAKTSAVYSVGVQGGNASFLKGKNSFLEEAKTLGRFSGTPGIVDVKSVFEENNTAYIVMQYISGQTLGEYVNTYGLVPQDKILELMQPVMNALRKIHASNLIHRDISPDNLKFNGDKLTLIDFGSARQESSETNKSLSVVVKHGFAPIEQYQSHGKQGPWTDIYALCATMYWAVTGKLPPAAPDRITDDELKRPSELGIAVTTSFENALMKGLAFHANLRYQSLDELIAAFQDKSYSFEYHTHEKEIEKAFTASGRNKSRAPLIIAAIAVVAAIAAGIALSGIVNKKNNMKNEVESGSSAAEQSATEDTVEVSYDSFTESEIQIGSVIEFGRYEQDNIADNGTEPVDWVVLEIEDNRLLLISEKCLEYLPYNSEYENKTWETCSVRQWLNGAFFDSAFSDNEKNAVIRAELKNDDNPVSSVDGGKDTEDRVFLLSIDEVKTFYYSDEARRALPTEAAQARASEQGITKGNTVYWWLRSPGWLNNRAAVVDQNGSISYDGWFVDDYGTGTNAGGNYVRPAVWADKRWFDKDSPTVSNDNALLSFPEVDVGSVISFGEYEQNNDLSDGQEDIEWIVLDIVNEKALLLSKYCLDCQQFNNNNLGVTWSGSTLRRWLNGEFLNNSFSDTEQDAIVVSVISNSENQYHAVDGSNDTTDKVFLLNLDEVCKYLPTDSERKGIATEYAIAQGVYYSSERTCWWWLRSLGSRVNLAQGVRSDGSISNGGGNLDGTTEGVRPAMWVDLNKIG